MAVVLTHPTKYDWDHLRPTVQELHREQQTAEYIAQLLGDLFGYKVT